MAMNIGIPNMFAGKTGIEVNKMLDKLGLPDHVGDMIGAQIDAARGDWAGYAKNMADLNSGMTTDKFENLFGKELPPPHFTPRPHTKLGQSRKLWGNKYFKPVSQENFTTGAGQFQRETVELGGKKGPWGLFGKKVQSSLESLVLTNPQKRAELEKLLGGKIVPDSRLDGKVTVVRYKPSVAGVPQTNQIANNPMLSNIYSGLSRMENNMKNLMSAQTNESANVAGSKPQDALKDPFAAQIAQTVGMQPPLSFEDMMFLFMMKYAAKKEKEIMKNVKSLNDSMKKAEDEKTGQAGQAGQAGQTGQAGGTGETGGTGEAPKTEEAAPAPQAPAPERRRRGYGSRLLSGIKSVAKVAAPLGGLIGGPIGVVAGLALKAGTIANVAEKALSGNLVGAAGAALGAYNPLAAAGDLAGAASAALKQAGIGSLSIAGKTIDIAGMSEKAIRDLMDKGGTVNINGQTYNTAEMSQTMKDQLASRMKQGGAGATGGDNTITVNGETQDLDKMSDTMKQQMLTKMMEDLKKMYDMLSNMMKSMHEMQMTAVRNLR